MELSKNFPQKSTSDLGIIPKGVITSFYLFIKKVAAHAFNKFIDTSIPIHLYLFSFFSILILRTIGEGYSQTYNYLNISSAKYYNAIILHTVLFYTSLALALACFFQIATGENLNKVIRFTLAGFIIILLTPIIDLIMSPIHGTNLSYLHPDTHLDIWYSYWTIFGNFSGISFGLRTEIFIAIGGFFLYFQLHHINPFKSVLYAWLAYTIIFFFAASPILLKKIHTYFNVAYTYNTELMILYFSFLNLLFGFALFISNIQINPKLLFSGFMRFLMNTCYLVIGIACCLYQAFHRHQSFSVTALSYVHLFFLVISMLFMSCSLTDADSKQNQYTIPHKSFILAFISVSMIAITNIECLFMVILYLLIESQFLYKPLQLNKLRFFSKLQLIIRGVLLMAIGYEFLYTIVQSTQFMTP